MLSTVQVLAGRLATDDVGWRSSTEPDTTRFGDEGETFQANHDHIQQQQHQTSHLETWRDDGPALGVH